MKIFAKIFVPILEQISAVFFANGAPNGPTAGPTFAEVAVSGDPISGA